MIKQNILQAVSVGTLGLALAGFVSAQSSRPRRVKPAPKPAEEPLLRPEKTATARSSSSNPNAPLLTVQPVQPISNPNANDGPSSTGTTDATSSPSDSSKAYELLQQKQFAAAAKEAKAVAANDPSDAEAWKIAGFAELNLKQYTEAASQLRLTIALNGDRQRDAQQLLEQVNQLQAR